MFACPNCDTKMPLSEYLSHARVCGTADKTPMVNLSTEDASSSNSSTTPAETASTLVCPMKCGLRLAMSALSVHIQSCKGPESAAAANDSDQGEKRSATNGNADDDVNKRMRFNDPLLSGQRMDDNGKLLMYTGSRGVLSQGPGFCG